MLTPPPRDRGNIALFGWLLVRFPLLGGSVDIGQSSRASAPATPRPGETSRLTPLVKTNLLCLACLMLGPPLAHAESVPLPTATPGGTIELRELELSAPEVAVDAYLLNFRERTWGVRLESRTAFMSATLAIDLRLEVRDLLFAPENWSPAANGFGFIVRPPLELLRRLQPAERRALYRILASWADNKPERWPLVFRDAATFERLIAAGVPGALVERARQLCYPFDGGFALSDFSVLAAEFPNDDVLRRFLLEVSTIKTSLPRLRLQTALSATEALAYWTVEGNNPFALPLLEALMEAVTEEGVELVSIMPVATRMLAFDLTPEEVRHDIAATSYMISANLAAGPIAPANPEQFFRWFDRNFVAVGAPPRYGDVLEVKYLEDELMPFACASIGGELVFARDPVGLGLWRFMSLEELQLRNPHFALIEWGIRRHRPRPATP